MVFQLSVVLASLAILVLGLVLWQLRDTKSWKFGDLSWRLLLQLGMFVNVAEDVFLPNLPAMARDFGKDPFKMSFSIQLQMFSFMLTAACVSMLAKICPRRPMLLLGLILCSLSSGFAALAESFGEHLVGRCAMGIGQAIYVLVDVIVADVYHDSAILTEKLTILYLMISLALVASPSVGSFCGIAFGWQSVFALLSFYAAVLFLLLAWVLPETQTLRVDQSVGSDHDLSGSRRSHPTHLDPLASPRLLTARFVLWFLNLSHQVILTTLMAVCPYIIQDYFGQSVLVSAAVMTAAVGVYALTAVICLLVPANAWNRLLLGIGLECLSAFGFITSLAKMSMATVFVPVALWYASLAISTGPCRAFFIKSLGQQVEMLAGFSKASEWGAAAAGAAGGSLLLTKHGPHAVIFFIAGFSLIAITLFFCNIASTRLVVDSDSEDAKGGTFVCVNMIDPTDLSESEVKQCVALLQEDNLLGKLEAEKKIQKQSQFLNAEFTEPTLAKLRSAKVLVLAHRAGVPVALALVFAENGSGCDMAEVCFPSRQADLLLEQAFYSLQRAGYRGCYMHWKADCDLSNEDASVWKFVAAWKRTTGSAGQIAVTSTSSGEVFVFAFSQEAQEADVFSVPRFHGQKMKVQTFPDAELTRNDMARALTKRID